MSTAEPAQPEISQQADEVILNAATAYTKEVHGEDFFVAGLVVVGLVERPRAANDKPGAPRFSLMVKTPMPVATTVAINMLKEAAGKFQEKAAEEGAR